MKNVQISFDEDLLQTIDQFAASLQRSRSAVVREAVKIWIQQKKVREFEDEWISRLIQSPPSSEESEAWLAAESWSDE